MILRTIRQNARFESQSENFVIEKSVRGNFHKYILYSRSSHIGKHGIQIYGIGRSELGNNEFTIVTNPESTYFSSLVSVEFKYRIEHICGRSFPVGTGNAYNFKFFIGESVKGAGGAGNLRPAVLRQNLREAGIELFFTDYSRSSFFCYFGYINV